MGLGIVSGGRAVTIADGIQASRGDLIIATAMTTTSSPGSLAGRWPAATCSASSP